jgi:starch synthase
MIASEAVPYAKTGGLADVLAALPRALGRAGHSVTLVVPRYRGVPVDGPPALRLAVDMGGHAYDAAFWVRDDAPGVRVVLVDHPAFFDRDGIYGIGSHDYEDNPRRFAFLTLAALEFARHEGHPVDVVHGHDWPSGLAPVYLRTRYQGDPVLGRAATVFTIHNVAYKGLCAADWLPQLGLDWSLYRTEGLEYWLHVSFLKGGIVYSDLITTVSQRYAQELQAPETAFGFEGLIRSRRDDLLGIRNGIDVEVWNPASDAHLPEAYDATSLEGKAVAKHRLLETFALPTDGAALDRPLVAMISRMIDQKGLDLIAEVADQLPDLDATFVVMGTGEPWYQEMWRALARRYPDRVAVRVGFDEALSHLIEAGADLFMMPSRYEPCGLNQMYSLRYGTVPVVRATGGLADTVVDADATDGTGNGFTFTEASGQALLAALRRALAVYRDAPDQWRALQRAGMARDFSWDASARAYVEAYEQALGKTPTRKAQRPAHD